MEKDILIVIDYQVDFVSGALANPAAETLEAGIEARVREYRQADKPVIFTKDTHLEEYLNTREESSCPFRTACAERRAGACTEASPITRSTCRTV